MSHLPTRNSYVPDTTKHLDGSVMTSDHQAPACCYNAVHALIHLSIITTMSIRSLPIYAACRSICR